MKYITLTLALCALFSVSKAQNADSSPAYQSFTLDNGLTFIVQEDNSVPMVTVNVWYHVGSGHEKQGRTGFAHLFEHIMFEGSGNVKEGDFDRLLEAVGGNNNGSTTTDRTNYYETLPSNALDVAFYLESDRMGFLLDDMSQGKVDGQRDVVKNERRQSYENQPYGMATETMLSMMYPSEHPYSWPVIGSMADLSAASFDDVVEFFKLYYAPNNASIAIVGDVDFEDVKEKAQKWFGEIPRGQTVTPPSAPPVFIDQPIYKTIEDQVQLPRIYMSWMSPAIFTPGDAEMNIISDLLTSGKNSRLYKTLVYDLKLASDVRSFQNSRLLGSQFTIFATARPGIELSQIQEVIDAEIAKLMNEAPDQTELTRVVNQFELNFLRRGQSLNARADAFNRYFMYTGNPDWRDEDLSRYTTVTPTDISAIARRWLKPNARAILSIVPEGKLELGVGGNQ